MLAGVMESNTLREEEINLPRQLDPFEDSLDHLNTYSTSKMSKQAQVDDPLGLALNINVLDSRCPYISFDEFFNETLSDNIEMDQDFSCYRCEFGSCIKYPMR